MNGKAPEGGKGTRTGNGKGKGIVKQTLGGETSQTGGKATGSQGNGTQRTN